MKNIRYIYLLLLLLVFVNFKSPESDKDHLTRRATEWIALLESVKKDKNRSDLLKVLKFFIVPSKNNANTADFYYDHWKLKPDLKFFKVEKVEIIASTAKVYYFYKWIKKDGSSIEKERETLDFIKIDGEWYRNREIVPKTMNN